MTHFMIIKCQKLHSLIISLLLLSKMFIFFKDLFLERGREGEREEEKHQCVVAFHVPPTGGIASNPGMCPRLGIEPVTLWFTAWHSIHWATPAMAEMSSECWETFKHTMADAGFPKFHFLTWKLKFYHWQPTLSVIVLDIKWSLFIFNKMLTKYWSLNNNSLSVIRSFN